MAAASDRSIFFSPRDFYRRALIPTPVPEPTATISVCMGNASVTAVSACSLICDTKILSTMLYNACTSIEAIIGSDMEMISRFTGITPILFSVNSLDLSRK